MIKVQSVPSLYLPIIVMFVCGCTAGRHINGWYPVADVPENRIEGKAIVTAEDFDVVTLDNLSYPDMVVIEGKLIVDKVKKWADATENRIGKRIGFVFKDSVMMATPSARIGCFLYSIKKAPKIFTSGAVIFCTKISKLKNAKIQN